MYNIIKRDLSAQLCGDLPGPRVREAGDHTMVTMTSVQDWLSDLNGSKPVGLYWKCLRVSCLLEGLQQNNPCLSHGHGLTECSKEKRLSHTPCSTTGPSQSALAALTRCHTGVA